MRLAFCLVVFLISFVRSVTATPDLSSEQLLERIWRTPKDSASLFAPAMLNVLPVGQVELIVNDLRERCGSWQSARRQGPTDHYRIRTDRCEILTRLHRDIDGLVVGLIFSPPARIDLDFAGLLAEIDKFDGTVAYAIYEDGELIAGRQVDRELGVASAFKLVVLAVLRDMIDRGEARWSDTVMLKSRHRSLGSGTLQRMPIGSPLTLHTLAVAMIADSDNTAADILIEFVGRDRLETLSGMKPFLTTKDMFQFKADPALYKRYQQATLETKYGILEGLTEKWQPSADRIVGPWGRHAHWLMSVDDLCSWIEKVADLRLMRINTGVLDKADWQRVAFKGGNDIGVLNLTSLAHDDQDKAYCISMTWNADQEFNQVTPIDLYTSVFRALPDR